MSGEDLYRLYVQANGEQNCEVDSWIELSESDRAVWDRMVEMLPDMPSAG